jgi:hypothetical protein
MIGMKSSLKDEEIIVFWYSELSTWQALHVHGLLVRELLPNLS